MKEYLKKLLAQRNAKQVDMQKLLDAAKGEERSLTGDEATSYDSLEKEYDSISADIKRTEKQIERERELDESQRRFVGGGNPGDNDVDDEQKQREAYAGAFVRMLKNKATSEDIGVLDSRAVNTGTDTQGGYLVPEEWTESIWEKLVDESDIRSDITIMQTKTTTNIPIDGDELEFAWLDELEEYPELQPTFGTKQLGAHKAGGVVLISREILKDSPYAIATHVQKKMIRGITNGDDKAFVNGDGTDRPKGIVAATTQEVITAAAGGIGYADLVDMKYAVPPAHRKRAKWRASDAFLKAVEKLVDGDGKPIFTEGSISKGTPSTLLGYPIEPDNNFDNALTTGKYPAVFGNFKSYVGADRGDIYVQILREKYATKGAIGILVDKRTDGDLADTEALAKLKIQ